MSTLVGSVGHWVTQITHHDIDRCNYLFVLPKSRTIVDDKGARLICERSPALQYIGTFPTHNPVCFREVECRRTDRQSVEQMSLAISKSGTPAARNFVPHMTSGLPIT